MRRERAFHSLTLSILVSCASILASCATPGKLPSSPAALPPDQGIVVFPIVVEEEYVNGGSLFADRYGPTSSLHITHDTLTETTSAFPLASGTITGLKTFNMLPTRKHRVLPAGNYETSLIDFGGSMMFVLDKDAGGRAKELSYGFTVEAGKVNYWGRCLVKIRHDLKAQTLTLVSLEVVDRSEEDLAEFASKAPAYASMPRVFSVGKSLANR